MSADRDEGLAPGDDSAEEPPPYRLDELTDRAFAAVLFDMDGTLIDSTPSVERAWASWAGHYGLDPLQLRGFHGIPAAGVIAHFLPEEVRERAHAHITDLEVGDVEGIEVLPGAREALAALAGTGRSAIATSCTDVLAQARLAATGLTPPDVVVTASMVTRGKPDPEPYLLAAQRLGVDPAQCLVVEDAPAGLAAGKAAGCATLAVVTTHTAQEMREAADADAVVSTLAQVHFRIGPEGVRVESADA